MKLKYKLLDVVTLKGDGGLYKIVDRNSKLANPYRLRHVFKGSVRWVAEDNIRSLVLPEDF